MNRNIPYDAITAVLSLAVGLAVLYWTMPIVAGIAAFHPLFTVIAVSVAAYVVVRIEIGSRFRNVIADLLVLAGFCAFWYFFNRLDGPIEWIVSDMGGMCPVQHFWGNHWRSWWTACMAIDISMSTAIGVVALHSLDEDKNSGNRSSKGETRISEVISSEDNRHHWLTKIWQWGKHLLLFLIVCLAVCIMLYGVRSAFDLYDSCRDNTAALPVTYRIITE